MAKDNTRNISQLLDNMKRAKTVALFCHISPDPDTFCSAFAMKEALEKLGKQVSVFCDDEMPSCLDFMLDSSAVEKNSAEVFDFALSVDCSDIGRLGNCAKIFLKAKDNGAIDHHKGHVNFAKTLVLDAASASCSEIILDILASQNLMDSRIAKILLGGLVADSGCFQFSNVTKTTHLNAAKLYEYEFNYDEVLYHVFRKKDKKVFDLSNRVLSKCRFFEDGKIAFVRILKDDFDATGTTIFDTNGIVSSAVNVDGVEIAFAVSEVNPTSYKVSIRTKNFIDANECAACFGGGGHVRAAGCRLNGFLEDVCDKLLKVAKDRLI